MICTPVAAAEYAEKRVHKLDPLFTALAELPHKQVALKLLRRTVNYSRVMHIMRTTPSNHISGPLRMFDANFR